MHIQPGSRLGPYEIVSAIGAGGMGEVYRATDTRLDRSVAIKVLPERLSSDQSYRRRLEREAKAISRLQHPHVCTLLDVGFSDSPDAPSYLVMEYLQGETLSQRLVRGPPPLAEALRIAREIAEAMEAAHRQGIVHRDLKPGNVMLTEHGTKVLDFGLAKGFEAAQADGGTLAPTRTDPITEEGAITGTVPYMAPEQLEGKPSDARTDLWALGCVIYEMVIGERPFQGDTQASLIASIMSAQPEPVSRRLPLTPERLDWVVSRCLEKDAERRWHSARDVAIELESISSDSDSDSGSGSGGGLGMSSMKTRRLLLGLVAALLVALVVGGVWSRSSLDPAPARAPSPLGGVAILPFETFSDDPDLQQLGRGIPEDISTRSPNSGPEITALHSTGVHAGEECSATAHLSSQFVLVGSVGRLQDRVKVNVRLLECPDSEPIWGDIYYLDAGDLVAEQDRVVARIITASQGHRHARGWEQHLVNRTRGDNERGQELARAALDESPADPDRLTRLMQLLLQVLTEGWFDAPDEVITEMIELGERCREADPWDYGCQGIPGWAYGFSGKPDLMIASFDRAIQLTGGQNATTYDFLSGALAIAGRTEEAFAAIDRALALDPEYIGMPNLQGWRSVAHLMAGNWEEARQQAQKVIDSGNNDPYNIRARAFQNLAVSLAHMNRLKEAKGALRDAKVMRPALTLEVAALPLSSASPEQRESFLEGLRLAGLGEDGLVETAPISRSP